MAPFLARNSLLNSVFFRYNVGVSGPAYGCGGEHRKRKGEDHMRKYGKAGRLETVLCNMCGKRIAVRDGIVREGAAAFDHAWDYFSEKDGEVHHFDLCESCYDELVGGFRIPVDVEEQTELL